MVEMLLRLIELVLETPRGVKRMPIPNFVVLFEHTSSINCARIISKPLADIHANHEECCDDGSELMLHHLAGNLAEERKRQFEDILNRLQLDDENLAETYQTIVKEVFIDGINWGRILAFLVFAGSLAVYCAREGMEERISDVISWTENDVEKTISRWMETQGGWSAFVDHFDNSWTIEVPPYILAGVFTAVVAGGLFLLKKLF